MYVLQGGYILQIPNFKHPSEGRKDKSGLPSEMLIGSPSVRSTLGPALGCKTLETSRGSVLPVLTGKSHRERVMSVHFSSSILWETPELGAQPGFTRNVHCFFQTSQYPCYWIRAMILTPVWPPPLFMSGTQNS